jgi:PAP2 superfamily
MVLPRLLTSFSSVLALALSPMASHAQEMATEPEQAQASSHTAGSSSSSHATPDPADLEVSWRKMPVRFLHDEKDMWLFPTKVAQGKIWLPAHTLATAISFSRVTTGAHFPSDVFFGAAAGFAISRFDVLRH